MLRRILIVYTSRPPILQYLGAAFQRLGIEVQVVYANENNWFDRWIIHRANKLAHNLRIIPKFRNLFEDHPLSQMNYRSRRLREAIAAWDPDLVFLIRGLGFRRWALDGARTKFGWWVEADERVSEALGEAPWYDRYFFINSASVDAASAAGYGHAAYLPHAVDPAIFRPLPDVKKDLDFCFVGLWSCKRQQYIEAALDVTANGAVYGPKWLGKTFGNRRLRRVVKGNYIGDEALVRLYNRTKVVINVTDWGAGAGTRRSGMTMRLFEVPATRSLLLTDSSADIHLAIEPGKHVATFENVADFREKLRFYLENDRERERIAEQGLQHVRTSCTYDAMAERLISAYDEVRRAA